MDRGSWGAQAGATTGSGVPRPPARLWAGHAPAHQRPLPVAGNRSRSPLCLHSQPGQGTPDTPQQYRTKEGAGEPNTAHPSGRSAPPEHGKMHRQQWQRKERSYKKKRRNHKLTERQKALLIFFSVQSNSGRSIKRYSVSSSNDTEKSLFCK